MKLCRFAPAAPNALDLLPRIGLLEDGTQVIDLTERVGSLTALLEHEDLAGQLIRLRDAPLPRLAVTEVRLLAPVERQEIWAAGVTYSRSKTARMEESDFSATAYDRVYAAPRPELFFKSLGEKVVGPGEAIGIRADSRWTVPEPELALIFNRRSELVGFTIANDVSARDIEGENLLYLPQAKIYDRACALGPCITVADEATARGWSIELVIQRAKETIYRGQTEVGRIKRTFAELGEYLWRSQRFPHGVVLLTGTGVVPPDDFSLQAGDAVQIRISNIGELANSVVVV